MRCGCCGVIVSGQAGPDLNVQRVVKRLDELLHIILVDLHYRGVEAIVLEPYIDALSSCSEQHSKFAGNATEIQLTQVFSGGIISCVLVDNSAKFGRALDTNHEITSSLFIQGQHHQWPAFFAGPSS